MNFVSECEDLSFLNLIKEGQEGRVKKKKKKGGRT